MLISHPPVSKNTEAPRAIGTVEDPIELLLTSGKSQVEQREVGPGRDVPSYHDGARQAVRQGLDVFVLGELRDRATAEVALQIANGGTLVLTTFHAASGAEALERLVFFFCPESTGAVQRALAAALHALISLQLVGSAVEGVRPKVEVLTVENQAACATSSARASSASSRLPRRQHDVALRRDQGLEAGGRGRPRGTSYRWLALRG